MTSSPLRPGASLEDEVEYYKTQYAQLETDLADFQSSSKDLEEQLERDIDAAEKKERKLKEQVEKLAFEAEEWKTKHRQAKAEANSAQNALQKEVTTLRESGRQMQLRLRDIEVVNDDYERQARNTESSLEDLESKYNVAIERAVLLEGEIQVGEQEREALRIETQRLRDEYGDLKVESEITGEQLRLANQSLEQLRSRKPSPLAVEYLRVKSPARSEGSGVSTNSPTDSTPPPKSDTLSDAATPPSPPLSDAPVHSTKTEKKTLMPEPTRSLLPTDPAATPRQSLYGSKTVSKHTRAPSMASSRASMSSVGVAADPHARTSMRPPTTTKPINRPSNVNEGLPRSDSLYQIKALRGRMQKIEERVHSARSKLPPPGSRTPTRGSPHLRSALGGGSESDHLPASVTMRRSIRGPSRTSVASNLAIETPATTTDREETAPKRRESGIKRLSFGIPRSASSASGVHLDRPTSALADRPSSSASHHQQYQRPASRTSFATAGNTLARPSSRAGAHIPLSPSSPAKSNGVPGSAHRPRSSMSGAYATFHGPPRGSHRPSASVSEFRRLAREGGSEDSSGTGGKALGFGFGISTGRRTTAGSEMDRAGAGTAGRQSAAGGGLRKEGSAVLRRSGVGAAAGTRGDGDFSGRGSGSGMGEMRPPQRPPSRRKVSDVGETY
ncbi:hypothetical protein LTR62_000773 [Meristemomyces frigidus]|uniref:NUDE domain-containing protein n=1 Tax=Meristemomyces frigidus TaxID=1508187 RepID=A0AAN7TNJ4_9PEZI|nr:hypothetical protein LTR62_000773 [Meristemomyces frigidus]